MAVNKVRLRQRRIDKMPLTLWGNRAGLTPEEEEVAMPVRLSEVSMKASPDTLRAIAAFLIEEAANLESNPNYNHAHWRMRVENQDVLADVIVIGDDTN